MHTFLLGLGLFSGLAVIVAGLVFLSVKKKIFPGICLVLAGVAFAGAVIMLHLSYESAGSMPDQPSETAAPSAAPTAGPSSDPERTPERTPEQDPTEQPSGTPSPAVTQTPSPSPTQGASQPTPALAPTPTTEPGVYTEVHYDGSTVKKPSGFNGSTVYLTFDDGPSVATGAVLDVLKKYNVKATFFVVGREITSETAQYVARAINEGHSVGIHTYTHEYDKIYVSVDAFLEDFYAVDELLKEQFNYRPLIFRFPGGASNRRSADYCTGIMTALTKKMPELGYSYFDWNVSPEDAMEILDPSVISQRVLDSLSAERAMNVVLMHDFDKMTPTAEALSEIIEKGLERGFAFDRLTPETAPLRHKVFN